jgi:alkylhydroperoxidase/carboxymuconolactone decarboxylase family protein YurZ
MMARIDDLPSRAGDVVKKYPKVWDAFAVLGETCAKAGQLDATTMRLVKLALAIGASSEGAVHSHVRRAIAEGIDPKLLEHVAILAIPTVGFPQAVRALTWIEDITE